MSREGKNTSEPPVTLRDFSLRERQ